MMPNDAVRSVTNVESDPRYPTHRGFPANDEVPPSGSRFSRHTHDHEHQVPSFFRTGTVLTLLVERSLVNQVASSRQH